MSICGVQGYHGIICGALICMCCDILLNFVKEDDHVSEINHSQHLGHVILIFPFPFGTRRLLLQVGHLKYLYLRLSLIFWIIFLIFDLTGHQ